MGRKKRGGVEAWEKGWDRDSSTGLEEAGTCALEEMVSGAHKVYTLTRPRARAGNALKARQLPSLAPVFRIPRKPVASLRVNTTAGLATCRQGWAENRAGKLSPG